MKLARKIMSIILTVMLVLSCIPMSAISASALADLGVTIDTGAWVTLKDTNGDGYYEIGNADELYAFSAIVNGGNNSINGILTNNIVINTNLISSSGSVNSGNFRRWTPIGTYSRPYAGHFKGNNKTISGLYADNDYETGLFGYSRNLIENVGVINSYIRGIENIGAIAGYNEGTIKNSYKTGAVRGDENVGGITGYNKGRVENCYNSGNVDSNPNINCHYIVGSNNGTITNCYYDISRSGELSGTTYKTSSQFASGEVAYLLGDAFGQTIGTDKLPVLGGNKVYRNVNCKGEFVEYSNTNEVSHIFDNGFCTNGDSYQPAIDSNNDGYYEIDNAGKLYWFAQQVNSGNTSINAILTADITVNEGTITENSRYSKKWTPIGNGDNEYFGIFDGNNKTISGLYFNDYTVNVVGLFGHTGKNSEIKNLGVVNSYFKGCDDVGGVVVTNRGTITNCYNSVTVRGYDNIGGVVGHNYGTVENCYNTGTVSGNGSNIGGVIGKNDNGTVTNCYNTGTVGDTGRFVGGITGYNHDGTITNCYNSGSVIGDDHIGGVVGENDGTITNCHNKGSVSNNVLYSYELGGIVGTNRGTVTNCYNVASVGDYSFCHIVGGIAGYNYGTVTNCYNTGTVSSNEGVGGVVARNSGTVTNCYNTGTVSCNNLFAGGVVGYNYYGTIENCYNTGTVSGTGNVGGVVGDNLGTVTNCYYLDTTCQGGSDGIDVAGSAEAKTAEQFASGEVAYVLGNAFGQTIGTDKFPVLGGKTVYPVKNCNGDIVKYSNTNEIIGHDYKTITGYDATCTEDGLTDEVKCSVCGDIKTAQTVIPVKGHNYITINGYDSTCTEYGRTDEVKCSVCGDIKTPATVIPAKGHNFDNGFCTVCGTYQPAIDSNEDGYFEIDNAGKLYWFAQQVNSGNTAINAILTADITVNEGEMDSILDDVKAWVSIGNLDNKYSGVFDGNNKTISGLHYLEENRQIGLFGCTGSDAEIKNVGVTNTYFNAYSNVGAICGLNNGKITNCYSDAFIGGYRYVGGIAGNNSGTIENCCFIGDVGAVISLIGGVSGFNSGVINNCYSTADIYPCDSDFGSVLGSNEGTITNCYYLTNGNVGGINGSDVAGSAEAKTAEQFASGEVAYVLGNAFGQTIGTDELPVLGGTTVYQITKCNGEVVKYSNTNEIIGHDYKTITGYDATCTEDGRTDEVKCSICGDVETPAEVIPAKGHKFDNNGFCTVCENGYQPAVDSDNDGYYEIDSASKLYWFAQQVNSGNTAINVILTADIVVNEGEITENSTDSRAWTPIGSYNNRYIGVFDGNNKTISGLYFNNNAVDYVGLFGFISGNSEIKNVGIVNSYFYGYYHVGGVVGENSGTVINCYNTGTVIGSRSDGIGGVVGENYGTVTNCYNTGTVRGSDYVGGVVGCNSIGTVTNCYNTGTVSSVVYVGGVVGYNFGTITNCYNTGTVSGNVYVGGVAGYNEKVTITNCYYLDTAYAGGINGTDIAGSAEAKTAEQFANGEVAYLLGEVFGQTIGTDEHPVLGGKIVYQVKNCNNDDAYSNTNETIGHNYVTVEGYDATCTEDGLTDEVKCSVCGDIETPQEVIPAKGHTHETVKGYDATCTEKGLTDCLKCSVCDTIINSHKVIPAKGHKHVTIEGYDATCTESGLTDEVKCLVCGDIKTPATVIPANGHNYNANGYCTECGVKAPVPNEPNKNMIYFKPSSNWYNDGARFVAYVWSDNAEKLIDLYDTDGDGYYEFINDNNWQNVIFCRHSSSTQTSWDNVWNQTDDLVIPTDGNNCYTLAEGSWSNGNGTWSKYSTFGQDYPINNKLYFKPNSNWYNDGARFVAYVWSDNAEKLIDLYDTDGDGYYEFINDNNWQNVIFCRHSSSTQTSWDNVWNQTDDLVIPTDGNNCYTLAEGAWSNGNGTWSKYGTPVTYDMGDIDLDGIVTIRDVSLLTKYLVACEALATTQLKLADVNGDGYININDATYIQKMLVELV